MKKIQEHITQKLTKTTFIKHIKNYNSCSCNLKKYITKNFKVIKKWKKDCNTKIHDALSNKKRNSSLNKQLYENGSSFLLNVYYLIFVPSTFNLLN